jgi:maleate isomerase
MAATRAGGVPQRGAGSAPRRLGVLTPSSNTVLEPLTIRLAAPLADELSLHFARFPVTRIADDGTSDDQFGLDAMLEAARLLADARVDALLWSGTSGSWLGLETDDRLVDAIREATGIPATTATQSLVHALDALHVGRYGLVVPYVQSIADAIVANLGRRGFECVARTTEDLVENWSFASVAPSTIVDRARAVAVARPEAIVIHCTNVRGAEVSESLERELGMPVLDSVVVGLWGALRQLGIGVPDSGFGLLGRASEPEPAGQRA